MCVFFSHTNHFINGFLRMRIVYEFKIVKTNVIRINIFTFVVS